VRPEQDWGDETNHKGTNEEVYAGGSNPTRKKLGENTQGRRKRKGRHGMPAGKRERDQHLKKGGQTAQLTFQRGVQRQKGGTFGRR